jgi:hydrogenase large subunit
MPRYVTPDMLTGPVAETLVNHYMEALEIRRKSHQMGAIFAGRLPCTSTYVVGGFTQNATAAKIADFRSLLTEIRDFVDNVYLSDLSTLAAAFPEYYQTGTGTGNLLAFGVFDLDAMGTNKLLARGRYTGGAIEPMDQAQIAEYVQYGWYTPACTNLHPAVGLTEPDANKPGAYSWLKAPRYQSQPYELGPLARMWINGDYTNGISVMDRLMARALETKKIADAMDGWLDELVVGGPVYQSSSVPQNATGLGLTEAPRGALGHWMDITNSLISRYQVITPTAWNASPRDDAGQMGPIETALVGVPVDDITQPVEVLRVVHSYDPCLACAVHMVRPNDRSGATRVTIQPAPC